MQVSTPSTDAQQLAGRDAETPTHDNPHTHTDRQAPLPHPLLEHAASQLTTAKPA